MLHKPSTVLYVSDNVLHFLRLLVFSLSSLTWFVLNVLLQFWPVLWPASRCFFKARPIFLVRKLGTFGKSGNYSQALGFFETFDNPRRIHKGLRGSFLWKVWHNEQAGLCLSPGPPRQATGPRRSGAGVGVSMLRGRGTTQPHRHIAT